ncbi:hypothetical protein [Halosolutus halophilus]|uniref:hypothetical protein n=1 Tax=Halosolutus halophilus TaxID=1552990 RepID=UPI0022352502|nr:hypothetical protein [Halosolutus halophilus]
MAVRAEDHTAIDFLANALPRIPVDDHLRDIQVLLGGVVKIEARGPVFATSGTLTVLILVPVEPSTDFLPATVLALDSFLPILVVPALLTGGFLPLDAARNVDPVRFRLDRLTTRHGPIERFQSRTLFGRVPAAQRFHDRRRGRS